MWKSEGIFNTLNKDKDYLHKGQCGQCVVIYLWKLLHVVNDKLGILDIVDMALILDSL